MTQPAPKNALDVLRYPEFRRYAVLRFLFIVVVNMLATLISWKVYEITKDPLSIGLIGLAEFVPAVAMAFYAGYVIDREDRRKILLAVIAGNLLLLLAFASLTSDYSRDRLPEKVVLAGIYAIVFCTGLARAFSGPTSFAMLTQLVPRDRIPAAITWHSGTWQVGAVTGPALAGLVYGKAGMGVANGLMVGAMSAALLAAYLISPKPPVDSRREESISKSVMEGFRFVWRSKEILNLITLDLVAVFFGGAVALLPYFSDVVLSTGAEGLGILRAAPGLGAIAIMIWLTLNPLKRRQGLWMLFGVAGFGACIIAFGLSRVFWLSFAALFLSGALDGISVVVRSTILQLRTPDSMRGRVASLNSIFIMSSNELGAFESGFAARIMGVIPSVVFGGSMSILVAAVTWIKSPKLRKLQY
jgi:MFS family permease